MKELGKLYVFEGIDGVGKTTLTKRVKDHLESTGESCLLLTFPGQESGSLGRHVYALHHNPGHFNVREIHPTSLQLLHIAAHIDAIEKRILPAIHAGTTVILDRYWWSTWVYGVVYGANPKALEFMVRAELAHWGRIRPTALFVLQRSVKSTEQLKVEDTKLSAEYSKLIRRERKNYPIFVVANKGSIEETTAQVLRRIKTTKTVPRFVSRQGRSEERQRQLIRFPRNVRHVNSN